MAFRHGCISDIYRCTFRFAAPLWGADLIGIDIGDNGPTEFYWLGNGEITGTAKENIALMPLEDIAETFKENIFLSAIWPTADMIKQGAAIYPFLITHIDLRMAVVPQQDALRISACARLELLLIDGQFEKESGDMQLIFYD